jgi:tetratricopeptide (TPR) repeat protein
MGSGKLHEKGMAGKPFSLAGTSSAEAARHALTAARAAAMVNDLGGVIDWSEQGLAHDPEPAVRVQLLEYLGTAVAFVGDSFRADRCFRRVISMAVSARPEVRIHPATLANLGAVYAHLGKHRVAVLMLRLAANKWWRQGRFQEQIMCHLNAAWMLLLAGDRTAAAPDLEAAGALLPTHGDTDQVQRHRIATALNDYLAGDVQTAEATAIDMLKHAELDPGLAADLGWLLGMIACRRGDQVAGRRLADLAYEQALVVWDPGQINRIVDLINNVGPGGADLQNIAGPTRYH